MSPHRTAYGPVPTARRIRYAIEAARATANSRPTERSSPPPRHNSRRPHA
ncbi:hypothetical protein OG923_14980 [Streptomyces halstedii]